jgi:hypothetical protein
VAVDEIEVGQSNGNEYQVGYKHPPKQTRFQKGQSGNPKGRPRGTRNFKTDLQEELSERVPVTINGRTKRISKQRLFMKKVFAKAISGDARAGNMLVGMVFRFSDPSSSDAAPDVPLSAQEEEAWAELSKRLVREILPSTGGESGSQGGEE